MGMALCGLGHRPRRRPCGSNRRVALRLEFRFAAAPRVDAQALQVLLVEQLERAGHVLPRLAALLDQPLVQRPQAPFGEPR